MSTAMLQSTVWPVAAVERAVIAGLELELRVKMAF